MPTKDGFCATRGAGERLLARRPFDDFDRADGIGGDLFGVGRVRLAMRPVVRLAQQMLALLLDLLRLCHVLGEDDSMLDIALAPGFDRRGVDADPAFLAFDLGLEIHSR